jgi:hypothetical protein
MTLRSDIAADTRRVQAIFLAVTLGTAICACILATLYGLTSKVGVVDTSLLVPRHRIGLNPKPTERFVFLVLAFAVPVVTFLIFVAGDSRTTKPSSKLGKTIANGLPAVLAAAFVVPFWGFNFGESLMTGTLAPTEHPLPELILCLLAAFVLCMRAIRQRSVALTRSPATRLFVWLLFAFAVSLQLLSWRLIGEASITPAATWWNSADAVIYSVSQVVKGKTILADLPSQYGLFAEILAPVFKVIGLSIFNFTAVCAAMQLTSLGVTFYIVDHFTRNPVIKAVAGGALVTVTFETSLWLIGIDERYFQYWPIRFFWPALSVFLFYWYSKTQTSARSFVIGAVAALATLWNADSGLMIEISFAAFLIGKWAFLRLRWATEHFEERSRLIRSMLMQSAGFALILVLLFAYMTFKADRSLHFSWLYAYQKLFYGLGFMMMPLPLRPSPWMSVLAVYLLGMLTALSSWTKAPLGKKADIIFFISFLGLGLFVYYEGRSHILNLITVSWPALILGTLMADRSLRLIGSGRLPRVNTAIPAVAIALMLFCCVFFAKNIVKMWNDATTEYKTRGIPSSTLVSSELAFIRKHSRENERCIILARRQGLYYAATGLISPLDGPGYAELITTQDRDDLLHQLKTRKFGCVFLGIGTESTVELGVPVTDLFTSYKVSAVNPEGTIQLLTPR